MTNKTTMIHCRSVKWRERAILFSIHLVIYLHFMGRAGQPARRAGKPAKIAAREMS